MSFLPRLTYNSVVIDFDRHLNRYNASQEDFKNVITSGNGSVETSYFYSRYRLELEKQRMSPTIETQIQKFIEYVRQGNSFTFKFDRDLGAYLDFEGGLNTTDAVAGTFVRATTASYIDAYTGYVGSAASGAARYQAGKYGRGIMIEKARTNLLVRSTDLTNASWTKTNLSVTTSGDIYGMSGAASSNRCVPSASNGAARQDTSTNISTNSAAFSLDICSGTTGDTSVTLQIIRADTAAVLATATVTITSEWARYQVVYTSAGSISANWGVNIIFPTNGGKYYVDHAQLEVTTSASATSGDYSSRIPTTTTSVSRNADSLTYTTGNIFTNPIMRGTVCFWITALFNSANMGNGLGDLQYFLEIENYLDFYISKTTINAEIEDSNGVTTPVVSGNHGGFTYGTKYHIALAWDLATGGTTAIYVNGVLIDSDTFQTTNRIPRIASSSLRIGANIAGGQEACCVFDDMMIRTDCLNATQIAAIYNMGKAIGYKKNKFTCVLDQSTYLPQLAVGGYKWDIPLTFVEQL